MKRSASSLLRALVRSGTRQSRSVSKLVTALFTAPAAAKPKRKRKAAAKVAKPAALAKPAKPAAKPAAPRVRAATTAAAQQVRATTSAASRVRATAAPRVRTTPPAAPGPTARRSAIPSAATHVPPSPGKWLASHYATPTRRMSYWLYLPNNPPEDTQRKGLPLLVMLHGCHQTATQFAQGTRMNQWAEQMGYAVLYPQQLVSVQAQRCWKWYDRATQEGGGDVPTIVGMIGKVMTQYAIDRSRIYIAGISAGAGMANIIALNHPQLFAAVGLHSGPVFGAGHNTIGALGVMQHGAATRSEAAAQEVLLRHPQFPGMPAILIQGEGDQVVRPINQLQLLRQSRLLNKLSAAPKITHKPQGRGGRHNAHQLHDFYEGRKLLLRVARIADLEHAWSGGDPALAFNAKAGPDASKMMLEFFARHRRT
ncbi:PHB depolymerase family esterase [Rugamonas sp. A1-17]|nr:PHB depolymerase family esterase [Rugamonas sp. A1-17]